jgi:hypothetical protein
LTVELASRNFGANRFYARAALFPSRVTLTAGHHPRR